MISGLTYEGVLLHRSAGVDEIATCASRAVEKWQSSAGLQKEMGLFVTEKLTEEGEASESFFLHFTFQMYAFFTCYLQA